VWFTYVLKQLKGISLIFKIASNQAVIKFHLELPRLESHFRNEITPGNFIFRTREFEQMEMQYFVKPGTDEKYFNEWKENRKKFYLKYGIREENI
jgi:glycyl-tRNA synthetase